MGFSHGFSTTIVTGSDAKSVPVPHTFMAVPDVACRPTSGQNAHLKPPVWQGCYSPDAEQRVLVTPKAPEKHRVQADK
ncbi:MAG: hypothetical protein H6715_00870 [Myxococcales bacterium]|nr:hypothetical protein [Myxococcales bacterium]